MMEDKLKAVLSIVTSVAALAYLAGWLKNYYFFQTFGIPLQSVGLSVQDHLFESWFVIENAIFLVVLWWVLLKLYSEYLESWKQRRYCFGSGYWRPILLFCAIFFPAVVYSLLPLIAQYAFHFCKNDLLYSASNFTINYRHTLLKFVPIIVVIVGCVRTKWRESLKSLDLDYSRGTKVLALIFFMAWIISASKHMGSFDALQRIHSRAEFLPRVSFQAKKDNNLSLEVRDPSKLYLLYATKDTVFIWDASNFIDPRQGCNKQNPDLDIFSVPQASIENLHIKEPLQVQFGWLWL